MNGKRYVARGRRLAARMLGDEMMIMSASTSTVFSLNEVAAVIWQAADGTHAASRRNCHGTKFAISLTFP